jgi:HlyD family type I secretion membrane fusion protein
MKLDFLYFGGGGSGGGGGFRGWGTRWRSRRLSKRLIQRYMRERLEAPQLDDARDTVRVGLIGAALFFGLFLLFALLAPISGAAVAEGEVAPRGDRLVIQPVATGLVSQVLIHEGQQVRAGQPLVRLNGIGSGAKLDQAQASRDVLRATEARLIAERDGSNRIAFPADLVSRWGDPTAREAMRAQFALFQRHLGILGADRAVTETRLASAEAQRAASETQLALVQDELAGIRQLYEKGFARKTTLRALERSAAQLEADTLTGAASVEEARINQSRTRDSQMMDIVNQLARVQEQLAQITPQLEVSRYYADRDLLRAPVTGLVSGLSPLGPGTVVSGGQTLMQIVPQNRSLIVEARVKPGDIDDVRVGQEATVRFSSVNPHGQSSFKGRVVTLSPARIDGQGGEGYFRAQIALDDLAAAAEAGVTLQPGIPARVNIKTEDRTLWDYLMAPLGDALSRSFREE